jgi:hypothetical protein
MLDIALLDKEYGLERVEATPKLKELIVYILDRCRHKPIMGETALNKILYFSDFIHYATTGRSITGVRYVKEKRGPVPDPSALLAARGELIEEDRLSMREDSYFGSSQRIPIAVDRVDKSLFEKPELGLVDFVLNHFCKYSTTEIAGITSADLGWRMADYGADVPCHTVWIRRRNLMPADALERARTRARLARRGLRPDSMSWGRVASSHPFDNNHHRLENEHPRVADVLLDIVYVLTREPRQFNVVDTGSGIWALRTDEGPWERTPALDVVYQIDEDMGTVLLLSAEVAPL